MIGLVPWLSVNRTGENNAIKSVLSVSLPPTPSIDPIAFQQMDVGLRNFISKVSMFSFSVHTNMRSCLERRLHIIVDSVAVRQ